MDTGDIGDPRAHARTDETVEHSTKVRVVVLVGPVAGRHEIKPGHSVADSGLEPFDERMDRGIDAAVSLVIKAEHRVVWRLWNLSIERCSRLGIREHCPPPHRSVQCR